MKVKSSILFSLIITSIIFTGCDIFNSKTDSNKDIIFLMYSMGLNRGSMTFTVSGQTINFISKEGFDYYPFGYSGSFESDSYDFSNIGIMVPTDVSQGNTYNEASSDFYFSNIVKYNTSFNTSGHNFNFHVDTWQGIGGKIEATFSGDICDSSGACILIENGSLEASIVDLSSM
jgi:hypothetical protein